MTAPTDPWTGRLAEYRDWLIASGKPANTTVKGMMWQMRRFAEAYPQGFHLSTAELARWLSSHNWAPATMKSNRATLRSFYGWAYRLGYLERDPAADLAPVRLGHREPIPTPESVLAEASPRDATVALMVELAACQGLRRAEVARVHARDVRRGPTGWLLLVHGKGAKERTIPLHADLAARILAQADGGWLFPSPVHAGPLSAPHVGKLIGEALPYGYTAHSLRRRFATRALDGSHDIRAVQRLLGHASIQTTQFYLSSSEEAMRAALGFTALAPEPALRLVQDTAAEVAS